MSIYAQVPIIEVPDMGNLCAVKACEEFKVASQNDTTQLSLAKEKSYKKAFYEGVSIHIICTYKCMQNSFNFVRLCS